MELNKFVLTAGLTYTPQSMDAFIYLCEGLIASATDDPGARFFLKIAVDEFTVNAMEHAYKKQPGEITVSLIRKEKQITLELSDQGHGVDLSKINLSREARSLEDLKSRGWAFTILNRISNGLIIRPNKPQGSIVSITLDVPLKD